MSLSWMINQQMLKICHHHFILLSVFFAQWLLIGCDFQGLSSYWLWHFSWPGKKVLGLPRPVKQGQPRCPWKSLDDKMSSNVLEVFTECAFRLSQLSLPCTPLHVWWITIDPCSGLELKFECCAPVVMHFSCFCWNHATLVQHSLNPEKVA